MTSATLNRPGLRGDSVNIVLMLCCGVLAHLYPSQLLLLSYAILGPAHYLTEISWLHDRRYFVGRRAFGAAFILPTILMILGAGTPVATMALFSAGAAAAAGLAGRSWFAIGCVALAAIAGAHFFAEWAPSTAELVILLLPSFVHITLFTVMFMAAGAMKSHSRMGIVAITLFIIIMVSFRFGGWTAPMQAQEGVEQFQPIASALAPLLPEQPIAGVIGLLAFAYSYHYLNWFAKTDILKWHKIPRSRLYFIIAVYVAILASYLVSFTAGFIVSLTLSVLHVLLEFPLNIKTMLFLAQSKAAIDDRPVTNSVGQEG